jgi:hypothetical protein
MVALLGSAIVAPTPLRPPAQKMASQTQTAGSRRARRQPPRGLARCIAGIREFFAALTSTYHPERHYMRGGGTGGVA